MGGNNVKYPLRDIFCVFPVKTQEEQLTRFSGGLSFVR